MTRRLKIALLADAFPPLRTSAAVQMRDLAQAFAQIGHEPVVMVPAPASGPPWTLETADRVAVLRLAAAETKIHRHIQRAVAEMRLPFAMLRNLRNSPLRQTEWDAVVCYSPTIFLGPLMWALGSRKTPKYLILRDIFPEWAVDLGIMRKGPAYVVLKAVAAFQYFAADAIGVQTESNLAFLPRWVRSRRRKLEVLHNWLAATPDVGCSISIADTPLAGRKIFVYIGNMGVAQGMDILIDLAQDLRGRQDIGFLFVGRGSDYSRLVAASASRQLGNVLFHDEIDPSEIPGLLAQCHVGLLALHPLHRTHNIPGKFVSYMHYGIPVLGRLNAGTDLIRLIEEEGVGHAYAGHAAVEMKRLAEQFADDEAMRQDMSERARRLGRRMFSPEAAAPQILAALGL